MAGIDEYYKTPWLASKRLSTPTSELIARNRALFLGNHICPGNYGNGAINRAKVRRIVCVGRMSEDGSPGSRAPHDP